VILATSENSKILMLEIFIIIRKYADFSSACHSTRTAFQI